MKDLSDFFEAIIFFGEIGIGQIGLQVISISLGRRGSGDLGQPPLKLPSVRPRKTYSMAFRLKVWFSRRVDYKLCYS